MAGLRHLRRAEMLAQGVRGIDARTPDAPVGRTDRPAPADLAANRHARRASAVPTMRSLDDKGRLRLTGLAEHLDWTAGELTYAVDGAWVVLRPAAAAPDGVRRRQVPRIDDQDRVLIPRAMRTQLGVAPGDELLVTVVTSHGCIAVANPAVVFDAAPLSLLDVPRIGPRTAA